MKNVLCKIKFKEFTLIDRTLNLINLMKNETNFDFSLLNEIVLRYSLDMLNYVKDKVTELISSNYLMKSLEIDKLYVYLIVKLFEYFYDEICKIEILFDIDFQETNNTIKHEMTKIFDAYYNVSFHQAVMNNKLNNFMEIYFFLLEISNGIYTKMNIDQVNAFIKYENGKNV